jgi:PAS domain S-box-containing protein
LEWNDQAERTFGWNRSEAVGKNFFDLIVPEPDRQFVEQIVNELLKGDIQKHVLNKNITKKGDVIWCQWDNAVLQDVEGNISAAISLGLDITDRINKDKELKEYREHLEDLVKSRTEELEAKNKEMETFTYSVSHDLKAPLRGIDGYSRLLSEEYAEKLDEEGLRFLANIRYSTDQMTQLIEDLLTYSRMERRDLRATQINIRALIDELILEREHEISSKSAQVESKIPTEQMICDRDSMRQIMGNLLDNAIKFTREKTRANIEIGGSETPDAWKFWVKDNGVGFDPKYQDRIFGIFQRLHRAEDYPGTGVGLALVQKAVHRMGGSIRAEGKPGEGAVFFLEIPKS